MSGVIELDGVLCLIISVFPEQPDPPTDLELTDQRERSVRLTWTPGDENNSPIQCEFFVCYLVVDQLLIHIIGQQKHLGLLFWSIYTWLPQCSWSNVKIRSTSLEYGSIWLKSQGPAPQHTWSFPRMCITPSGSWHSMMWVWVNPALHPDSTEPTLHVSYPSKKIECLRIFIHLFLWIKVWLWFSQGLTWIHQTLKS